MPVKVWHVVYRDPIVLIPSRACFTRADSRSSRHYQGDSVAEKTVTLSETGKMTLKEAVL